MLDAYQPFLALPLVPPTSPIRAVGVGVGVLFFDLLFDAPAPWYVLVSSAIDQGLDVIVAVYLAELGLCDNVAVPPFFCRVPEPGGRAFAPADNPAPAQV